MTYGCWDFRYFWFFFDYTVPVIWRVDIIVHYFLKSRKFKLLSSRKIKKMQRHPTGGGLSQSWEYSSENDPGQKSIHIFPHDLRNGKVFACVLPFSAVIWGEWTPALCDVSIVNLIKKLLWLNWGAAHYFIGGNDPWINSFQIIVSKVQKYAWAHRVKLGTLFLQMWLHFLHFIFIFYRVRAGAQCPH